MNANIEPATRSVLHPNSYWAATAAAKSTFPSLREDIETDVAIIGGGFTGLSAAYHLQRAGVDCVILEANEIGWGASGRTGGIAIPRYKLTFPELEKKYGIATALGMYRAAHKGVDTLEAMVADCNIDCGFNRCGHITPVVHSEKAAHFEADVRWLERNAADRAPTMLRGIELERRIGTRFYHAGYFEPRAGGIHPLKYCQQLAEALVRRGVRIFCRTLAEETLEDSGAVVLRASHSKVRARRLIMATNAYTNLSALGATLKSRIVPMMSSIIATSVLPSKIRESLLVENILVTDSKRLTNYFRMLPDGRLLFGGRGGVGDKDSDRAFARCRKVMCSIFPQLEGVAIDYRWSGMVAVTLDSLPHIGQVNKDISFALGYNGRGVALSALMGSMLAKMAVGDHVDLGPMTNGRFERIPFHSLRIPAKQIVISYYQLLDKLGL